MLAKTNIQNTVESELMNEEVIMHHQEGNRIRFIISSVTHRRVYNSNVLTDKKAQEIENYIYTEKESNNFGPRVPKEFNGEYICENHKCPHFLTNAFLSMFQTIYLSLFKNFSSFVNSDERLKIAFYKCLDNV